MKLRQSIELHCEGNPFTGESPLKSALSSALVPEKAKEDILCYAEKGQKRFEAFVEDRLLQSSKHSLWDAMKKLRLVTLFANGLLARFSSNTTIKLVMVYNNKIQCSLILLRSSSERNTC